VTRFTAALLGLAAISIAIACAVGWALWPEPRLDPSVSLVHGLGTSYLSRDGYYTYPPSTTFTIVNEWGQVVEFKTDEQGLRDRPRSLASAEILILGDSFAAAPNTRTGEMFSADLERLTGRSVYNAGVDGFSTFQEVRLLRHLLRAGARPDTVIVLFFMGNDFRDNYLDGMAVRDAFWLTRLPCRELLNYFEPPPPEMMKSLRRTGEALAELKNVASARDLRLLVVGVPSQTQAAHSLRELRGHFSGDVERMAFLDQAARSPNFSLEAPDRWLYHILAAGRIDYLSLTSVFRKNGGGALFGKSDPHWTARGQEIAAEAVAARFPSEPSGTLSRAFESMN
jgi:hypothetical protein